MPGFRDYIEVADLEPTDIFLLDRLGGGTRGIDGANLAADIQNATPLLPPADPLQGDELMVVIQDGVPKQTTDQDVADLLLDSPALAAYVNALLASTSVANYAALRALTAVPAAQVYVRGSRTLDDGGEGVFIYDAADTTSPDNGGTIIAPTGVLTGRWKRAFEGPVNVKWFGAYGDYTHDDTTSIQAAVDTGLNVFMPIGDYVISAQIHMTTKGQQWSGSGIQSTFLRIQGPSAGFVQGIIYIDTAESAPELYDMCISCAQPDTNVRANLNAYPPVIYMNHSPRAKFGRLRIVGGIDGIYMFNNCGGTDSFQLQLANFGRNIYTDGNLDVTSFTDCQVWPFSDTGILSTNLQQIFYEDATYGYYSLRNDYLAWSGGLFLVGTSVYFGTGTFPGLEGWTYGGFVNCGFDTQGNANVADGSIMFVNCRFSVANGNLKHCVTQTGGDVFLDSCEFVTSGILPDFAMIYCNVPTTTTTSLRVRGCSFGMGLVDLRAILITSATSASFQYAITDNRFYKVGPAAFTNSIIEIQGGGPGTISGNTAPFPAAITGNVNWLAVTAGIAGPLKVVGNSPNGWTTFVNGSGVTAASTINIPPVLNEGLPNLIVTGSTTINAMTFNVIGIRLSDNGEIKTLIFNNNVTVNSGTLGTPGNFILSGRTAFNAVGGSSLTVQLDTAGNWREIGRCQ